MEGFSYFEQCDHEAGVELKCMWHQPLLFLVLFPGVFPVEERGRRHLPARRLHRPDGPSELRQPRDHGLHAGALRPARVLVHREGQRDLQQR